MRWQLFTDEHGPPCGGLVCFPLDVPQNERDALAALLSAAERERAARFRSPVHAQRFVAAHGRLRQCLAAELGLPAAGLEFAAGEHGKPMLSGAAAASGIQFNLSHSDDLGLVGWTRGLAIGVDVERWRPMRDESALVRRFFSTAENAAYGALPPGRRSEGFFNCWTRKEAYVKAVGRGLGLPLHSFDVSLDPACGARLLRASVHGGEGPWSLAAPATPAGVSIAVVIRANQARVMPYTAGAVSSGAVAASASALDSGPLPPISR